MNISNWDATTFFSKLTESNRLAASKNFVFCRVSGLEGFEEALASMQSANNFVCVSDIADGYTELNNTPRTRRIKTVFFAMRHAIDDMQARADCFDTMQELFRQFMSLLILQRVKLEEHCIYVDPRITFNEIDRYFFSGCACAYFQVAVDKYTDLRYSSLEWDGYYGSLPDDRPVVDNSKPLPFAIFISWYDYDNKTKFIKAVREISGMGLGASKEWAENSIPGYLKVPFGIDAETLDQGLRDLRNCSTVFKLLYDI